LRRVRRDHTLDRPRHDRLGENADAEDDAMRRATLFAGGFAALLTVAAAAPAFAGYGALSHDDATGKYGLSWDKQTQQQADDAAMKDCAEGACKIIFRTKPRQCGAIATSEKEGSTAWGGGVKGTRDAAQLAAIQDCQKRTKGQCKVRAAGCNR
jgi:hypothetical protein